MRRRIIWTALSGYLGVNFLMFLRFFFPRALFEPSTVFNIGYPADFALGIDERFLNTSRCWIVRQPDRIFAIYARCTLLVTAAATTRRALTLKDRRRDPWTGHTWNWTPPERSSWIPAGCLSMIRMPASTNLIIRAPL
jgi:hypothetical protein